MNKIENLSFLFAFVMDEMNENVALKKVNKIILIINTLFLLLRKGIADVLRARDIGDQDLRENVYSSDNIDKSHSTKMILEMVGVDLYLVEEGKLEVTMLVARRLLSSSHLSESWRF